MNKSRKMVKPGINSVGKAFQVVLPGRNRNVKEQGESLVMTPFLERRILSGELVEMKEKTGDKK